jgi:hypothetical protein
MMIANMLYLSVQTSRVPILPQFVAMHHLGPSVGSVAFSEVFDVPRLARTLGKEILDWTEVKNFPAPGELTDERKKAAEVEKLGCWSTWAVVDNGRASREGSVPELLGLGEAHFHLDFCF